MSWKEQVKVLALAWAGRCQLCHPVFALAGKQLGRDREGGQERQGPSRCPLGPFLCPQESLGCRLVFLLMQYCVAANYYWLLVEGVYLYTLLALSVFSEQRVFRLYLSIGWGKACRHSSHPYPD